MSRRILCLVLILFGLAAPHAPSVSADSGPLYTVRERMGVNVARSFGGVPDYPGKLSDFVGSDSLGFGWYSDWGVREHPETPNDIEFVQLLHTSPWPPDWGVLERAILANPGSLWIIGNEPETRGQGGHTPEEYAVIYHEAHAFISDRDSLAQVAIGGVVQPTPLRLEWLERCLAYYEATFGEPIPIDVWNIHVQILQEKRWHWGCGIPFGIEHDEGRLYEIIDNCNVDIFQQLVEEFCTWMYVNGQRDKPLIISEYGVLMPSNYLPHGDRSVSDFMQDTMDYMLTARHQRLGYAADEYRMVQRWMWFSLNFPFFEETPGGFNGALYDWQHTDQLTLFGELYQDYAASVDFGELIVSAEADTTLDVARPDEPLGTKGRLKLRYDADGQGQSALVRFALAQVPDDAQLFSGELLLHTVARSNPQLLRVDVTAAMCPWSNDTTYSQWQDCSPSDLGHSSLTLGGADAPVNHDVTPVVKAWLDGALPNRGFWLDPSRAMNGGNVGYDLAASEWVEGPQQPPALRIRYMTRR